MLADDGVSPLRLRTAFPRAARAFARISGVVRLARRYGPPFVAVAFAAAALLQRAPHSAAAGDGAFAVAALDTIAVYGAKTFATPTGATANHVEQFSVAASATMAYELLIEFGDASGANRPQRATVRLNGATIATELDFANGAGTLRRRVEILPSNVLEVSVEGGAGAFVRATLLAFSDGTMSVFGPRSYDAEPNKPRSVVETFALPPGALPPYRLHIRNGEPDGTLRASSATVHMNGVQVIGSSDLNQDVAAIVRDVQVGAQNQLEVTVTAPKTSRITVRVTATDGAPPVLAVTAPLDGAITRESSVVVSGTVDDATPVHVTINGQQAAQDGAGGFTAAVPLTAEGQNVLTIVATDAAGNMSQIERHVIRDTAPPALSITSVADGFVTRSDSVLIAGTANDAGEVTVLANAQPLSVGPGGAFSGRIPLDVGLNTLVVSATDRAGNQTALTLVGTRDTLPPNLTVTTPAGGESVTADSVPVNGTVTDETATTVTVSGVSASLSSGGAFSARAALAPGLNTIRIVATDAAGNATTIERSVTRSDAAGELPPDPSTVAPALDRTVATNLATATSFLYTGANPIQRDADSLAFVPIRAAVVRGRVLERDGAPLPGARVTVKDHPEYGWTLSRADGMYDLAVNGGGSLTLDFDKSGYLRAQRQVSPRWQDYEFADDVALVRLDPIVTSVDLTQADVQVARGSVVTDTDGSRRATVLIEPGTSADLVLPGGLIMPITSLSLRATEYTVGPNGRMAMPAALPPQSAYTYAVELSADEAIAAGATSVQFSQPVALYVENFLDLPIGTAVPVGYYDYGRGMWVAEPDGIVVRVLSTEGSWATLDIDGNGTADTDDQHAAIGVTDGERLRVASLYQPGQSLWRSRLTHFSTIDKNQPPADSLPQPQDSVQTKKQEDDPCKIWRSVVECENQSLGETIGLTGTPFSLTYRSHRTPGYTDGRTITIPLSGPTIPAELQKIYLQVLVAGVLYRDSFPALPNQSHTFNWDGKDAYGRTVQGRRPVTFAIGYAYPASYAPYTPDCLDGSGGGFGTLVRCETSRASPGRGVAVNWVERTIGKDAPGALEFWDARTQGLGGWSISAHHAYDPTGRVLHMGDGSERSTSDLRRVITSITGQNTPWGSWGYNGDGQSAANAILYSPMSVAVAPDGSYYIADASNFRVRRVGTDGIITTVAGTGTYGFTPDGTPAAGSPIDHVRAVAVGSDGTLYIVETGNNRIRSVGSDGILRTIAGSSTSYAGGFSGDGGPATAALLDWPTSVAVATDGSIYIGDEGNHRIRRVGPDGIIRTVAGLVGGPGSWLAEGVTPDGAPARGARLSSPRAIVAAPDGSVYFAEPFRGLVRRITSDGLLETVAGGGNCQPDWNFQQCGDGGPATEAELPHGHYWGMALGADGTLYISAAYNVRAVAPDGVIRTVAGQYETFMGNDGRDGGPATAAVLATSGIAVAPDGSLYITDPWRHRVRRVAPVLPGFSSADFLVASESGREIYEFDASGRHLRTLDALMGRTRFTFGYDANGRLVSITDIDSLVTRIERDGSGKATAVLGHYGQRTQLSIDSVGYLAGVTAPGNETVTLAYTPGGLLTSLTDPRNNEKTYAYMDDGRLLSDSDPVGGSVTLARTLTEFGNSTTVTTAMGRTTTYTVDWLPTGEKVREATDPSGLVTRMSYLSDGSFSTVGPDSTRAVIETAADPRLGMQSPLLSEARITTPSGLRSEIRNARNVTLADASNPLSAMVSLLDSTVVNDTLVFTSSYDGATRTATTRSPEGRQTTAVLDAKGRVLETQVPGITGASYGYDADGRLTSITTGSRTTTFAYDTGGHLTSVTDPLERTSRFFYDAAGRTIRQVLPDQREILYGRDATGNLTSLTPPSRPAHMFGYTGINLTEHYTPPSGGAGTTATRYSYDLDRQLTRVARPDGHAIDLGYDSGGRLSSLTLPNGTITYGYSPATGNLTSVTAPAGVTLGYTYDGSLPTNVSWTGPVAGSVAVTYNNNFQVTQQTVNGGSAISFSYDRDGLLTSAGALTLTRGVANGLLTSGMLGHVANTAGYSALGELASLAYRFDATPLFQTGYTRDDIGRITQVTETVLGITSTSTYGYDLAGRLEEVRKDGVATEAYTYDDNGNRLSFTETGGVVTGTYDEEDRLLTYGNASYTYTVHGELVSKTVSSATTMYDYDVLGNLRTVTLPHGTTIDYLTDGQNRRIGKKVNGSLVQGFLYSGQLTPAAELDGAGNVVSAFVYATRTNVPDYLVKDGATYRLITDHLGSVRLVVNAATGAVAQRIDYDTFGRVTLNTAPGFQPFGFAGGLYDVSTGLVRFGARDYDAEIGRWTSKDPIGFDGGNPNLYAYTGQDPLNWIDPSGLVQLVGRCDVAQFLVDYQNALKDRPTDFLLPFLPGRKYPAGFDPKNDDWRPDGVLDTWYEVWDGYWMRSDAFGNFAAAYATVSSYPQQYAIGHSYSYTLLRLGGVFYANKKNPETGKREEDRLDRTSSAALELGGRMATEDARRAPNERLTCKC